jgi:hypothetical protein
MIAAPRLSPCKSLAQQGIQTVGSQSRECVDASMALEAYTSTYDYTVQSYRIYWLNYISRKRTPCGHTFYGRIFKRQLCWLLLLPLRTKEKPTMFGTNVQEVAIRTLAANVSLSIRLRFVALEVRMVDPSPGTFPLQTAQKVEPRRAVDTY